MTPEKVVIGDAELWWGDCREVLPLLPQVDAVITDPPYGIKANKMTLGKGQKKFFRGGDWDNNAPDLSICVSAGRLLCFWGGNYFSDQLPVTNDWLIWYKMLNGVSFSECEMAWTNFGSQTRHLSHHWSGEIKSHPTQKPLRVMLWSIEQAGPISSVIDPFMGSGTTGVACATLGKSFIGIERERKYFDIACQRIAAAQAQGALFDEVPAALEQQGLCLG